MLPTNSASQAVIYITTEPQTRWHQHSSSHQLWAACPPSNTAAPGTPGWLAQLKRDRQLANSKLALESLRSLAKRYDVRLAKSTVDMGAWRTALTKRLDDLIDTESAGRRATRLQGSSLLRRSSIATTSSRRRSVSSAAPGQLAFAAAAAAAEGGACSEQEGAAGGQGLGALPGTPKALPTSSAKVCSVLVGALTPSSAAAQLPQVAAEAEGGAAASQPTSVAYSLLQQQLAEAMQKLQHQQQQIDSLQEQVAAISHTNLQLKQQVAASHAAGMRQGDRLMATELGRLSPAPSTLAWRCRSAPAWTGGAPSRTGRWWPVPSGQLHARPCRSPQRPTGPWR